MASTILIYPDQVKIPGTSLFIYSNPNPCGAYTSFVILKFIVLAAGWSWLRFWAGPEYIIPGFSLLAETPNKAKPPGLSYEAA